MDNTVIVTFGNLRQKRFTENWVQALTHLGIGGLLVGMMNMSPSALADAAFARELRARGVGVYPINSAEVRIQPQGGRWFHVLPLLHTGARVILSDSDVVWFRDPRPYLRALELAHPRLDFSVSSDAQQQSDAHRLTANAPDGDAPGHVPGHVPAGSALDAEAARVLKLGAELDVEDFGHCWHSMNIGIYPPLPPTYPPPNPPLPPPYPPPRNHALPTWACGRT